MPASTYFVSWKGRHDGPYSVEQLAELLQRGEISLLHRVETDQGSVPLRQLLQQAEGGRWAHLLSGAASNGTASSTAEGIADTTADGKAAADTTTLPASARPGASSSSSAVRPRQAGVVPVLAEFLGSNPADPAFASRAYTLCGLSFIFPPLAWFVLKLAGALAARGSGELARRVRLLAVALAVAGCVFWGLLIKFL